MSEPFDWLLGGAVKTVSEQIEGTIEREVKYPFSIPIFDTGFKLNELIISETKKFVAETLEIKDELSRIAVFTSLNVKLDRDVSKSVSNSENKLYLIRSNDGKLSALLFMQSSTEEK